MARKLKATTIVKPEEGDGLTGFVILGPDDEVPAWAEEQIGEHLWEEPPESASKAAAKSKS